MATAVVIRSGTSNPTITEEVTCIRIDNPGIGEAPIDGNTYGRKDGGWVNLGTGDIGSRLTAVEQKNEEQDGRLNSIDVANQERDEILTTYGATLSRHAEDILANAQKNSEQDNRIDALENNAGNRDGRISDNEQNIIANRQRISAIEGNFVDLTSNQTIGGEKTFSFSPLVPVPTVPEGAANKLYVDALDSENVKITGDQEVDGLKTFIVSPIVPAPSSDSHATNRKFVTDLDGQNVKVTGGQSISGNKVFSNLIAFLNGLRADDPVYITQPATEPNHAMRKLEVDNLDAENVKLTTDQEIEGIKTFTSSPLMTGTQTVAPTALITQAHGDVRYAPIVGGGYLPLTGGTITGNLGVNGTLATGGDHTASGNLIANKAEWEIQSSTGQTFFKAITGISPHTEMEKPRSISEQETTSNSLVRYDYLTDNFLRMTGSRDQSITGVKTFEGNAIFSGGLLLNRSSGPQLTMGSWHKQTGDAGEYELAETGVATRFTIAAGGIATFSNQVRTSSVPDGTTDLTNKLYVDGLNTTTNARITTLDGVAVKTSNTDQSIAGVKTFTGTVIVPTPSADNHAATRAYVDSLRPRNPINYRGLHDASTGVYPDVSQIVDPAFWIIRVAGTIAPKLPNNPDPVTYEVGDTMFYSPTDDVFVRQDSTDAITSVNGKRGAVVLSAEDNDSNLRALPLNGSKDMEGHIRFDNDLGIRSAVSTGQVFWTGAALGNLVASSGVGGRIYLRPNNSSSVQTTFNPDGSVDIPLPRANSEVTPEHARALTTKTYVDTLDGQNVKRTGNQSVAGEKTFTNLMKLTSSINLTGTGEQTIQRNTGAQQFGLYFNDANVGFYDWKNTRQVTRYAPGTDAFEIRKPRSLSTQEENAASLTRYDYVNQTIANSANTKVSKSGDTMTGHLTMTDGQELRSSPPNLLWAGEGNGALRVSARAGQDGAAYWHSRQLTSAGVQVGGIQMNGSGNSIRLYTNDNYLQIVGGKAYISGTQDTAANALTRYDAVVKNSGNETIAGNKTFTNQVLATYPTNGAFIARAAVKSFCGLSIENTDLSSDWTWLSFNGGGLGTTGDNAYHIAYGRTTQGGAPAGSLHFRSKGATTQVYMNASGVFSNVSQSTATNALTRKDYVDSEINSRNKIVSGRLTKNVWATVCRMNVSSLASVGEIHVWGTGNSVVFAAGFRVDCHHPSANSENVKIEQLYGNGLTPVDIRVYARDNNGDCDVQLRYTGGVATTITTHMRFVPNNNCSMVLYQGAPGGSLRRTLTGVRNSKIISGYNIVSPDNFNIGGSSITHPSTRYEVATGHLYLHASQNDSVGHVYIRPRGFGVSAATTTFNANGGIYTGGSIILPANQYVGRDTSAKPRIKFQEDHLFLGSNSSGTVGAVYIRPRGVDSNVSQSTFGPNGDFYTASNIYIPNTTQTIGNSNSSGARIRFEGSSSGQHLMLGGGTSSTSGNVYIRPLGAQQPNKQSTFYASGAVTLPNILNVGRNNQYDMRISGGIMLRHFADNTLKNACIYTESGGVVVRGGGNGTSVSTSDGSLKVRKGTANREVVTTGDSSTISGTKTFASSVVAPGLNLVSGNNRIVGHATSTYPRIRYSAASTNGGLVLGAGTGTGHVHIRPKGSEVGTYETIFSSNGGILQNSATPQKTYNFDYLPVTRTSGDNYLRRFRSNAQSSMWHETINGNVYMLRTGNTPLTNALTLDASAGTMFIGKARQRVITNQYATFSTNVIVPNTTTYIGNASSSGAKVRFEGSNSSQHLILGGGTAVSSGNVYIRPRGSTSATNQSQFLADGRVLFPAARHTGTTLSSVTQGALTFGTNTVTSSGTNKYISIWHATSRLNNGYQMRQSMGYKRTSAWAGYAYWAIGGHDSYPTKEILFHASTGALTCPNNVTAYSDARLKKEVKTIDGALDKVRSIRGVTYVRNDDDTNTTKMGVIAQEIEKVCPEVVVEADGEIDGKPEKIKTVDYGNMVGLLIEAIKEQQKQIELLSDRLEGLCPRAI